jgi:hypothetical protein
MLFDPKKSRRQNFQRIFTLGMFWCGVSRYAATPLIGALSPGHVYITSFYSWSPIAPDRISLHRAKKKIIQNLLRRFSLLKILIRVQAFRDRIRGELPHVQIFKDDVTNPLT